MVTTKVISATNTVVTVSEAQKWLGDITYDDEIIEMLIEAVTLAIEHKIGRKLRRETWQRMLPHRFPITIRESGIVSLTSLQYYDTESVLQTIEASTYDLEIAHGTLVVLPKKEFPSVSVDVYRNYPWLATFETGFADAVPADLKVAMLSYISTIYTNRECEVVGSGIVKLTLPASFDLLLARYRVWSL